MIHLSRKISIPESEIEFTAVRSQGPGGQHVNKASTGVHLRFDIKASSLPEPVKLRLLHKKDSRISEKGEVIIKVQSSRSQLMNKKEAMERLVQLIEPALIPPRKRVKTKPSRSAVQRRLEFKSKRSLTKSRRQRIDPGD